ncbi:hypothetical protein GWI33_015083 [Rhynchophorus ferrugineus]|uniref:Glucose dehydrogenase n=1 Tax=Rhynchophorus ferrugineus TaxID=354439 RepID=A0A834I3A2_RHYFE|nr:hypothetical protein GWI33_015083 [Rhynchophorus ferrugineus]
MERWLRLLVLYTNIFSIYSVDNDLFDTQNKTNQRVNIHELINSLDVRNLYQDEPPTKEETFDFIVVGSGSAGAVVANRLSENPNWNVLLLEVGDVATPFTEIPVISAVFQYTKLDWGYTAEREEGYCWGCPNRRMHWPRGRALGGTTALNYMIHVRGNPLDYDRWEAMGNPGWGYKDVLPYFKKLEDAHIKVYPMLVHPKSYGYLRLKSKNPFQWPLFYPRYFTDPGNDDIKTFIAAIREIQRINRQPAFQRFRSELYTKPIPGCEQHAFNSDAYWECALRTITPTLHHQVATCKMGPSGDPEAVVDNRLKVHGIRRLRVVDTSIIPLPISAHVNIPAVMVGEKASDIIKEDWTMRP